LNQTYSMNSVAILFLVFSSRWRIKIVRKALDIFKKTIIIFQIDFIYCRVELERKLCYHIVHVTDYMKPLVSLSVCEGTFQFLIKEAENDNNKGKRRKQTVLIHGCFSRETDFRSRYLKEEKLSSIKCALMRLRYCTARTGFRGYGEYIYIYVLLIFLASFSGRC